MEKQLGGERLGSGSKAREMSVFLHNYERSTFNQSRKWQSTLAAGTFLSSLFMLLSNSPILISSKL